jgi:DNA-binding transcriptional LysR family regulator
VKNISGTVTVGSFPVMAPYRITDILSKFKQENTSLQLDVIQKDDICLLRRKECDFVFIRTMGEQYDDIILFPITSDTLAAILPDDHPLANAESVKLEQLKGESFLLLPKNTRMYNLCISECEKAGYTPKVAFTGSRAEDIISLVRDHMGVGLLTKKPVYHMNAKGISVVNIVPPIITNINLAYLKNANLSAAARHFLDYVKSFVIDANKGNAIKQNV